MYQRAFVIVLHRANTDGDFKLEDLPGSGGRIDIFCRALNSGLLLSHGIRKDAMVYGVLLGSPCPPVSIKVLGDSVKYLNPDERSTGALIRNALIKLRNRGIYDKGWIKTSPGIYASKLGLKDVLEELKRFNFNIYYLREDGTDIRRINLDLPAAFVMSDSEDLTQEEEEIVEGYSINKLSIGPRSLHTEHCIVIVNNEIDRRITTSAK
ncbi:MAG TPA: tRNA (pseudouridine(54)-N(1))-methyltransferase TrmY [Euryarchaeota archaeon]|nr:tRNA (pseudouridine(54)-N(1))-methyltransferase TrmY [Euryarchaeota archaeon]